ncbi:uncharacterized protein LOC116109937 [Pistacia vera]|uniref:uncharacterized protein LOC116109937 n=1 Tax=Pistacia vera TaxID=55513 RepID=UPI001262D2E6|nr:uncharacterized protein LOC116109937 [Pistacia vera]
MLLPPLHTTVNIGSYFSSLMERDTYRTWKSQFLDVLAIHDLQHVIAGDARPSTPFLSDGTTNPTHSHWSQTDRLVLTWIKSTVSPSIVQNLLLPCTIVAEAWIILNRRLNPLFSVHLRSTLDRLHNLQKAIDQSMIDYLIDAKSVFDSLSTASFPVLESNFVEYNVDGLGPKYQGFITALHLRPSTTFDELFDLLVYEERLEQKNSSLSAEAVPMAANRTSLQSSGFSSNRRNYHSRNRGNRGGGRGGQNYQSRQPPPLSF